jgi:hypothetical protein
MAATRPAALVQRAVRSLSPGAEIPSPALSPFALRAATPPRQCGCAGRRQSQNGRRDDQVFVHCLPLCVEPPSPYRPGA